MKKIFFTSALLLILSPCIGYSQTTWHPISSEISFKIKNAGLKVKGEFSGLQCELLFSPEKLSVSKLSGSVSAATLNTGIGMRDKTIKEEKYLNADSFKVIEISSEKLYPKDAGYAGMFKVTIKGVTKEMEIPFDFIPFGDEAEFKGTFTINRRDFGVGGNSLTMSDEVEITISVKTKK